MAKPVLQLETIHSGQAFAAKMKHNYRIGEVKNADPDRIQLNKSLIDLPTGMTYNSFFENRIMRLPYYDTHKIRKNAIRGFEVMMSYGTKNLPEDFDLDKWSEQCKKFLLDEFGKDNVASAILHMDEGVPHIHAVVVPVKDGRLNASAFFPDRESFRSLHRRFYSGYMEELGLEEENGYMHIEHGKVGKFYANINKALEKSLPGPEEGEALDDYAARANEFYQEQMLRNLTKDHQIKMLSKENEALTKANRTAVKMADKREAEIMEQIGSIEEAVRAKRFYESFHDSITRAQEEDPEFAREIMTGMRELSTRFGPEQEIEK